MPDVAGPFTWDGSSSSPAPGTIWRTGTGQFTALVGRPPHPGRRRVRRHLDRRLRRRRLPRHGELPRLPARGPGEHLRGPRLLDRVPVVAARVVLLAADHQLRADGRNGVTWLLQKVDGWDSPPSAVGQVIQRSADHGGLRHQPVFRAAAHHPHRHGLRTGPGDEGRRAGPDAADGARSRDLGTFTYGEPVPKVAYVRRNASAGVAETYMTLCDVIFQIPLVAPDPRKYDPDVQSLSSVTATPPPVPLSLPFSSRLPGDVPVAGATWYSGPADRERRHVRDAPADHRDRAR